MDEILGAGFFNGKRCIVRLGVPKFVDES